MNEKEKDLVTTAEPGLGAETTAIEYVSLANLTRFKSNMDNELTEKIKNHTHTPDQIIETTEKKFVSQTEKDRWNNTYTKEETYNKTEIDNKFKDTVSGLSFKGIFKTVAELPQTGKDGDYAVVTEDPQFSGQNRLFMYETTEPAGWKDYGTLIMPGLATESLDGLMSKEQVKLLTQAVADIVNLKSGEAITALAASKVTQDAQHRFVTDDEKTNYSDKYTKTEVDGKIDEAKAEATKVNQALEAYKTSNDARVKTIEDKIAKIATNEQIDALFGKKK